MTNLEIINRLYPQFKTQFSWRIFLIITVTIILIFGMVMMARGEEIIGYASWYSVESCKREGTSGIMANGKELKDDEYTCATWDWPFGTILRVFYVGGTSDRSVVVIVTDRGPNKTLYKKGRIIDLSKVAFSELAELKEGIIRVKIERIN